MAFVAPLMAAVGPWMSIASGVVGAIGAMSQANAASASEQSAAQAAQYNATINRQRAEMALQQGNAQEEAQRRENRQKMGNLRAGLVENGVGLDSGTGSDLVQESALNTETDALNIRYNAQMNARGYESQAALDDYSAKSAKARAKAAKTSGLFGAASSILTGASKYYAGTFAG
jgi:hypothetical protein